MFDKMLGKSMGDIHLALTKSSANSIVSPILLFSETMVGVAITKSILFSGTAWILRKAVELLFGR